MPSKTSSFPFKLLVEADSSSSITPVLFFDRFVLTKRRCSISRHPVQSSKTSWTRGECHDGIQQPISDAIMSPPSQRPVRRLVLKKGPKRAAATLKHTDEEGGAKNYSHVVTQPGHPTSAWISSMWKVSAEPTTFFACRSVDTS